jgi:nicotinamidase-related amidase
VAGKELPIPPHFQPERVPDVWPVPYEQLAADAHAWSREHRLTPAADDSFRICLLAVDCQNTFCTPGFELFVAGRSGTGAADDSRRLCELVYRNLASITQIAATLDTHEAMQIFHALFLVDADGRRPPPFTSVTVTDVETGRWRVDGETARSLGRCEEDLQRHLLHYVRALADGGKYDLTVWPYHALLGGIGHALVSAVEEAFFFHTVARRSRPIFRMKGREPLTEHYSVLGPEVTAGLGGELLGERDTHLVEVLGGFDAVLVAGQAKSHCVAWTIDDLLDAAPGLATKVYLLEDCTSPVTVPGVADYTDRAEAAFSRFAEAGAHLVQSTEPLATWPGVVGEALS